MAQDPSFGIDPHTGRALTGWEHVCSCIRDMLMTRFGARLMREWYGTFLPDALGRNITRGEMLPVFASITSAIDLWEPRFEVIEVVIDGGDAGSGELSMIIRGHYRPRALLGDLSVRSSRDLSISLGADENLTVR